MANNRGSIRRELVGFSVGVAFVLLFWLGVSSGVLVTASTAFGQWFVDTFLMH
jgi:hypothetical protein